MAANSTQQTTPADGTIEEVDGRYVLRFERRFRHPVEKVWDAITRPERITQWFGEGEVDLDLVEGGKFHFRTTGPPELVEAIVAEAGEEALVAHDTVLRVDPPRLFEHTETHQRVVDVVVRLHVRDVLALRLGTPQTDAVSNITTAEVIGKRPVAAFDEVVLHSRATGAASISSA